MALPFPPAGAPGGSEEEERDVVVPGGIRVPQVPLAGLEPVHAGGRCEIDRAVPVPDHRGVVRIAVEDGADRVVAGAVEVAKVPHALGGTEYADGGHEVAVPVAGDRDVSVRAIEDGRDGVVAGGVG